MMTNTIAPVGQTLRMVRKPRQLAVGALLVTGVMLGAGCSSDDSASPSETTAAAQTSTSMKMGASNKGGSAEVGDLKLTEARIGEPAGPATGMFLTIDNTGDQPDTLVAVTTKVSPEVQLHETIKDGDSTAMKELPGGVQVPAQASVILKPGGTHAMMMKVDRLAAGDEVPVTLTFKNAGDVEMDVLVVPLAELGGDGHMDDMDKGDDADAHSDG